MFFYSKISHFAHRSNRRSLTGGPSSSGYESMRTGASELSLSHPDSASECSAKGQHVYFLQEQSLRCLAKDNIHFQLNNNYNR